MKFNFWSLAGALLVAIVLLLATAPDKRSMTAQEVQQKQAEVSKLEDGLQLISKFMTQQQELNELFRDVSESQRKQVEDLADAINHVGENMVDKSSVIKLVTTTLADEQAKTADSGDGCTCGEKLADLQRQIDELKAKLASVECNCNAYATASYGASSAAAPVKSGGSTGTMMKATSGGSTGSVVYSQPVYSQPVVTSSVTYTEPVVVNSMSTTLDDSACYVDEFGVQHCPQQLQAAQSQPTFRRPLRSLFRR